jgi:hypothetical protein
VKIKNGLLRQPRYEGLRPDKNAIECRREPPAPAASEGRNVPTAPNRTGQSTMPLEKYYDEDWTEPGYVYWTGTAAQS